MQADRPKQYLPLLGKTVIEQTVGRFVAHPAIAGVVVVVDPEDRLWPTLDLSLHPRVMTAFGGAERVDSVLAGLEALSGEALADDWIMVHDVARPCLRMRDLDRLIAALAKAPDGALLAVPVADTVKRSGPDGCVEETVARERLWRAFTPQVFGFQSLMDALSAALESGVVVTDDSSAMERAGFRPQLVECAPDNQKITFPEDLPQAEAVLKRILDEERV